MCIETGIKKEESEEVGQSSKLQKCLLLHLNYRAIEPTS